MLNKLEDVPSHWPSFLKEIDQAFTAPVELHCLGGFVLDVLCGLPRPTDDLDYIAVIPNYSANELEDVAGRGSKLSRKYRLFIQYTGGFSDYPDSYEDRLTPLDFDLDKLSLKVLEPYDLALSKLTRNNPKDREDVKLLAAKLKLSFKTLMERFEAEMRPYLANSGWHLNTLNLLWREYFLE